MEDYADIEEMQVANEIAKSDDVAYVINMRFASERSGRGMDGWERF